MANTPVAVQEKIPVLKWKVGDVTITRVVELELPGLSFILPDAIPENLRSIEWLAPHFVTKDWEPIASIHTLIVESMGQTIMVDTCIGNDKTLALKFWCNRKGPFLQDLDDAGYSRDSVDTVLCTHLHPDHVGWNTILVDGKWTPTFPKAEYLFGRLEWEHWDTHRDAGNTPLIEQSLDPILDAGLRTLVETDHRITDEIWLEPTPGHTPGHASVHIKSAGQEAVITGDLLHHPCQMAHTDWKCTADVDADAAVVTRKKFLDQYAEKPVLVIGTHFAAPTAGHIFRDGDAFRFEV